MNSLKSHVSRISKRSSLHTNEMIGGTSNTLISIAPLSPPSSTPAGPQNSTISSVATCNNDGFPYEKLERVGKGSFGEVYKGINLKTQQMVAIKIVDLDVDYEPEEFQAELALLAQCSCEYIVRYYGAFLRGTQLWMIMDYCGGGSVRELVSFKSNALTIRTRL